MVGDTLGVLWLLLSLLIASDNFRTHAMNDNSEQWGMVQKRGYKFIVGDKEEPFYVNGFNTYWLMSFAVDESTRGRVCDVLHQASNVELNVCRTWAFNDGGYRALQVSPGQYDEEVFKALDFVISEARRHRIRLILSLCNNWPEYGGKAQYVKWGNEAGLNLSSDDDFFRDQTIREYYKSYVKAVLTRVNTITNMMYKDDPTILAWELINEPRCSSDPSGDALQSWIEEMASYVKSIDSKHLVEIGSEGFYGPSSPERLHHNPNTWASEVGTDFIRNHQVPEIDFASVHIYTDSWLPNATTSAHLVFVKNWMEEHMEDTENTLNMPVVFGEFGVKTEDERFGSKFREAYMNAVYNTLLKSRKKGGSGGGCLLWQVFPEGADHMDDGYAVILTRCSMTSNMISDHDRNVKLSNFSLHDEL